jgi:probable rRNA maturation factor
MREPEIEVAIRNPTWLAVFPEASPFAKGAARAALEAAGPKRPVELSLVLADDELVQALNREYRGVDSATNVLAFAAHESAPGATPWPLSDDCPLLLGDVVLALETIRDEAAHQDKTLADHLSHLVVHGVLHLVGFDHDRHGAAAKMRALETRVLARLGIAAPYRARRYPKAARRTVAPALPVP